MSKGGEWERRLCEEFSLWWSNGDRDDCFWRTSNSGGRATVRGRKGKSTSGHCGDIGCTDAEGAAFTKVFVVETKRGYNHVHFSALVDRPSTSAKLETEKWIEQAENARVASGARYWLLVHRRDLYLPTLLMPYPAFRCLKRLGAFEAPSLPIARLEFTPKDATSPLDIVATTLGNFFKSVKPRHVRGLL